MKTIKVPTPVSLRLGQETLATSCLTCRTNCAGLTLLISNRSTYMLLQLANLTLFRLPIPHRGRSDRDRTRNPRFWRPVLYQLSYTPPPRL